MIIRLAGALLLTLATALPPVAGPSCAAAYPELRPGAAWESSRNTTDIRYAARLRLLGRRLFILREEIRRPGHPPLRRTCAGLWRQIRDGAFVSLENLQGMERLLTVGGAGLLYGDMPVPGGSALYGLKFSPAMDAGADDPESLPGVFLRGDGRIVFRESGSGREFSVAGGAEKLPDGDVPLFGEADVVLHGESVDVLAVRGLTDRIPAGVLPPAPPPEIVAGSAAPPASASGPAIPPGAADVADIPWRIRLGGVLVQFLFAPASGGVKAAPARRKPERKALGRKASERRTAEGRAEGRAPAWHEQAGPGGELLVSGPGLHVMASYRTASDGRIRIRLSPADQDMLRTLERRDLLDLLLGLRRWSLEGGALILLGRDGSQLGILERPEHS